MKRNFTKADVLAIRDNLMDLCLEDIAKQEVAYALIPKANQLRNKAEFKNFIEGIRYTSKYIIKQYFDAVVQPTEEGEFIVNMLKLKTKTKTKSEGGK